MTIRVLDREEFCQYFEGISPGLAHPESFLWVPEKIRKHIPSNWFVCIRPMANDFDHGSYWTWCKKNCQGQVLCYSSGADEEWWGFTEIRDIPWWILRWGKE